MSFQRRSPAMNKIAEYRKHAEECRRLAASTGAQEHREQLLEMAGTWERMATERKQAAQLDEPRSFEPTRLPQPGGA